MSQNSVVIANGSGSSVRSALNNALDSLATNFTGTSRPSGIQAGQIWIDTDTPSSTVWSVYFYDGSHDVKVGEINSTSGNFTPFGAGASMLASPAFSGSPTATTQSSGDNSTKLATTAYADAAAAGANSVGSPQGRLTLASGTPVMNADATAQTSVYYTPYVGANVPIYNGSAFINKAFAELTMTLNTSNQTSGNLYDLFVFLNSGTVTIGAGPAWSSGTSRGTGAGTTELQQVSGIWTNKNSITLKNSSTTYSGITANQATYVGTVYATANGQTGVMMKPAAASGGGNNIVGLSNAYNRVRVRSLSRDSATWTYATNSWRKLDNSTSNRISFVDGLQQSSLNTIVGIDVVDSGSAGFYGLGVNLDSTSATPNLYSGVHLEANQASVHAVSTESFLPQLGFHYVQAMEFCFDTQTATLNSQTGSASQALILELDY